MAGLKRKCDDLFPIHIVTKITWKADIEAAIEAAEAVLAGAGAPPARRLALIILRAAQGAWPALGGGRGAGHPGTRPVIGQY